MSEKSKQTKTNIQQGTSEHKFSAELCTKSKYEAEKTEWIFETQPKLIFFSRERNAAGVFVCLAFLSAMIAIPFSVLFFGCLRGPNIFRCV